MSTRENIRLSLELLKDCLNVSILRLVKTMLVTSHHDVIAAFKAR